MVTLQKIHSVMLDPSFRKTPPILEKDAQREISPKTPEQKFSYNGSTANSPSKNVNPTHDRSFPRLPSQPRQSRGLPDRERGPIPAREAPQAPVVPPMGAKISKLKEISKRKATDQTDESIRHSDRHTDQSRHARQVNTSNSSHDRLPTPEHLISGENKSQPPSPQVFSPTTPRDLSTAHQVFIRSDDGHTHGISVPMAGGLSPFAELPLVPNLLNSNHSRDPSETLTITSLPNVVRSPQPQKPHSTKKPSLHLSPHPRSNQHPFHRRLLHRQHRLLQQILILVKLPELLLLVQHLYLTPIFPYLHLHFLLLERFSPLLPLHPNTLIVIRVTDLCDDHGTTYVPYSAKLAPRQTSNSNGNAHGAV
ncbi:hypothetical protein DID88_002391 [Monilinia fructigena]|uniref:Uncharacterized protein n=1 Tax=Monilinia fructigena TaxID=38457 RepID=A0A395ID39_9HELO|nr:hypothetical protein DID88_002391 [Monilinia fructigena]